MDNESNNKLKEEYLFIFINSLIYGLFYYIYSYISFFSNNNFLLIVYFLCILICFFFEHGGELIISIMYSKENSFKINFKLIFFSIFCTHLIPKLFFYRIYYKNILLFSISQIIGLLIGFLLRKDKKISE